MKNIIVCIKQVPDTTEVRINPDTNNLIRDGVRGIMNPADRSALEIALDLKYEHQSYITVISMGPPQAKEVLEAALCMGADRAILLCDRKYGGADTLATSYALANAISRIEYDLILCGVEAIDGCTGQVGAMLGETLRIPTFTYVSELSIGNTDVEVTRDTGGCIELYEAQLPIVACMLKRPFGREMVKNQVNEIEIWDSGIADENRIGSKGSPTRVVSIKTTARKSSYLFVPYDWDLERRMEHIFNGGIATKGNTILRGSDRELARFLLDELYQKR